VKRNEIGSQPQPGAGMNYGRKSKKRLRGELLLDSAKTM
jgi:hypothetical protein